MSKVPQEGFYIASSKRFRISVPVSWRLCETEQDFQVESPSTKTAVIVTTFKNLDSALSVDTREHLSRFLRRAPVKGKAKVLAHSKSRSSARYKDSRERSWKVVFLAKPSRLLLATCNSEPTTDLHEMRIGQGILESIKL